MILKKLVWTISASEYFKRISEFENKTLWRLVKLVQMMFKK